MRMYTRTDGQSQFLKVAIATENIFLPNKNFHDNDKLILWPAGSLKIRAQNEVYFKVGSLIMKDVRRRSPTTLLKFCEKSNFPLTLIKYC